jgi:hypothetical protein
MPYKDPENKRQWEREHREHRNAQRRTRRVGLSGDSNLPKQSPKEELGSPWGIILGCATGLAVLLLAALGGEK